MTPEIPGSASEPREQKPSENTALSLPKAVRRRECLREMREAIENDGPWTINRTFFAEKYGFDRNTTARWYDNLSKSIRYSGIIPIRNRSIDSLCRDIGICERIINDPNTNSFLQLKAMERQESLFKTLNALLEAYGLKEKRAETTVPILSLDLNRVLEIAKAKAERMKKAQETAIRA